MTEHTEVLTPAELAARLTRQGDHFVLNGAVGWMQGRTMYGGASSMIAYSAARREFPDLPPLRAAQIGFIGPLGDNLTARVAMLRSGKSVSHVETSLWCDGALVHRATWLFGSARADNGAVPAERLVDLPARDSAATPHLLPGAPSFTRQLDVRRATSPRGEGRPVIRRWVRFHHRAGLDPYAELIAIGDALPPGAFRAMKRAGPISSINWSFTVLGGALANHDGWYLLETASNHFGDGFSSETLRAWNDAGVEVLRGLQSVAIFG